MWHLQLTCEKWEDKLEISYELYQFVHTPKNCNEQNNASKKFLQTHKRFEMRIKPI